MATKIARKTSMRPQEFDRRTPDGRVAQRKSGTIVTPRKANTGAKVKQTENVGSEEENDTEDTDIDA